MSFAIYSFLFSMVIYVALTTKAFALDVVTAIKSYEADLHNSLINDCMVMKIVTGFTRLRRGTNPSEEIWSCPICAASTQHLKHLLDKNQNLPVTKVQKTVLVVGGSQGKTHLYLIVPDHFGRGQHLYIDGTIQQFFINFRALQNTKIPRFFVGSKEELQSLFLDHFGEVEGERLFVEYTSTTETVFY